MTDLTVVYLERIAELEARVTYHNNRASAAVRSRDMWRARCRAASPAKLAAARESRDGWRARALAAERTVSGSQYLRRRVRELTPLAEAQARWLAQVDRMTA